MMMFRSPDTHQSHLTPMKTKLFTITWLVLILFRTISEAQVSTPYVGGSQKSKVCQSMGIAEVCVAYSSPDVVSSSGKNRRGEVWGGLVPYGWNQERWMEYKEQPTTPKPWRAGANENTVLSISHDIVIEGKKLPAGSYGLFFVTGEKEWTLILSKDSDNWGHYFYDEKNDSLRATVRQKSQSIMNI